MISKFNYNTKLMIKEIKMKQVNDLGEDTEEYGGQGKRLQKLVVKSPEVQRLRMEMQEHIWT